MQFHKVSVESFQCLSTFVELSSSIRMFASFTIEMTGNETEFTQICGLQQKMINKKKKKVKPGTC